MCVVSLMCRGEVVCGKGWDVWEAVFSDATRR